MSRANTSSQPSDSAKTSSLYGVKATYSDKNTTLEVSAACNSPEHLASCKAAQLQALLNLTYGGSAEEFSNMADELRDNLMWLAADLALEIRVLCDLAAKMGRA